MPDYYPYGHRVGQGYTYPNTGPPPTPGNEGQAPQPPVSGGYRPPPGFEYHSRFEHQNYPPPIYYTAVPIYWYDPYGPQSLGWGAYDPFAGRQPGGNESDEEDDEELDTGDFRPPHPQGIPPPPSWRDLERSRQPERQPAAHPPEPPPQETSTRRPHGRPSRGQGLPPPSADPSGHVDWVSLRVFAYEAMEDLRTGRPVRGRYISVPQNRTVDQVIDFIGGGPGFKLVEVSETGNMQWSIGRSIEYGSREAATRIEELGWTRARNGAEAPPVWVVLCRV